MSAANTTNWSAALKTLWPRDEVERIQYKDSPLYALVPKQTDWDGEAMVIPIEYGQINGAANGFVRAKANKAPSKIKKMTITTSDNFALWSVDGKLERLSRTNKGAVVRALEAQTKSGMTKIKRRICRELYGNGGGSCGKAGTGSLAATDTVTLTSRKDARNFEEGDIVVMSAADGLTGSLRSGTLEVESVDTRAGTVTFTTNVTTGISAGAASDYFFIDGDHPSQGTGPMYGIPAYVTPSVPTTTIWGMTRTANPTKLGGIRVGGKGMLTHDAISRALTYCDEEGAPVSHIFCHSTRFNDVDQALGTQRRYVDSKVGTLNFSGLEFTRRGGGAPIGVYSDPDCDIDVIHILTLDTWVLHSAGAFPDFLIDGGNGTSGGYIVEESSNSKEGRIGGYSQFYTVAPGHNARLDFTVAP